MSDQDVKDQLSRVENKLDEHTKILASVDKTLALQAQQLETHIKRTDLAEENMALLRKEMQPIKDTYNFIARFGRILVIVAAVAETAYYVLEVLSKHH